MNNQTRWHQRNNAEEVAQSAVHWILLKAQEAISHRGKFTLVLAGGSTPKRIYEILADQYQQWSKWHLYLGDERCLDLHDTERNSLMIKQCWLDKVQFPMENFHLINSELGAETAALEYAQIIKPVLPFDLTLLGIGEDGHTASLFPGQSHNEDDLTHAVFQSPKPPSDRVSLSKKALFQSLKLVILVTGKSKQSAVRLWLQEGLQEGKEGLQGDDLPIAQIKALNGIDVLIDNNALPEKN